MTKYFLKFFLKRYRQQLREEYAMVKVETMQKVEGLKFKSPIYKETWMKRLELENEMAQKISNVERLMDAVEAGFKVPEEIKNLGYCLAIIGMIYWLLILNGI